MRSWLVILVVAAGCGSNKDEPAKHEPAVPIAPVPQAEAIPPAPVDASDLDAASRARLIAGSRLVSDRAFDSFGVGPGFIYSCVDRRLYALPKLGGREIDRGPCTAPFQFLGDERGVVFCDGDALLELPPQGEPTKIADVEACLLSALDPEYAYVEVPSFGGIKNPGLYRIPRAGGTPTKLVPLRPDRGDALIVALDGDELWVGRFGSGAILRMPKSGGGGTTVISDQQSIVDLVVDREAVTWLVENSGEIRRRARRGGPISVVARGVVQEPVVEHAGTLYWLDGMAPKRLMRLSPDDASPVELAGGFDYPTVRIDDEGLYLAERTLPHGAAFGYKDPPPGLYMWPFAR